MPTERNTTYRFQERAGLAGRGIEGWEAGPGHPVTLPLKPSAPERPQEILGELSLPSTLSTAAWPAPQGSGSAVGRPQ